MKPIILSQGDIDRFWEYTDKSNPTQCWAWTGCRDRQGYGMMYTESSGVCKAHRISWKIHNGNIPNGLGVLHDCPTGDCPWCVNPSHLWVGTVAQNNQDKMDKGRFVHGDRTKSTGENSHFAKLSLEQVEQIRARYSTGRFTYKEIASEFSISFQHVGAIITRSAWE